MYRLHTLTALLVVSFIFNSEAAKILAVYPTPSISHQVVFRPLTNELVRRGHEVVVITTDPQFPKGQAPENLTEIDVHDISYSMWRSQVVDALVDGNSKNNLANIAAYVDIMTGMAELQFQTKEVMDIVLNQNKTFDLIIVEAWTVHTLGFSHVIKVPVIQFSSFGPLFDEMDVIGAAYNPVIYPQAPHIKAHNMTRWERLQQYYNHFWLMWRVYEAEKRVDDLNKTLFGPDTPPITELKNNVHMIFFNIHPIWEGNRPVPPSVVYIPGLHQKEHKELPSELQSYLDASIHGVIYISFGTNVNPSLLPPEKVQKIIEALSELPYDVLWKWNDDVLPGRPKNVKISKWLPQSDLLRHPNIKLFITQGGLQSTDEAITGGVPLVGIPMLGDQWLNVEKYVQHKIGQRVDLQDLEVDSFKNTIKTVINDKSYRENVARLRSVMQDQPMPSLERAVWWTEHVLRHGGAGHLRAPAANMPWAQYYELELVLIVLGTSVAVIILALIVVYNIIIKLILRQIPISTKLKNS